MILTTKNRYRVGVPLLSLTLVYSPFLLADKIVLNNGRSLIGEIKQETPSHVVLSMGGGTISFLKSKIKSISYADYKPTIGRLIEFDYPEQLTDIAISYKQVKASRRSATKAKEQARQFKHKRKALLKQYSLEEQKNQSLAQMVKGINPNLNPKRYNQFIAQLNRSTANLYIIQNELSNSMNDVMAGKKIISEYVKQLAELISQLENSKLALDTMEDKGLAITFLGQLENKLSQFDSEFKSLKVPHEASNGHMILNVKINNSVQGRFLLDTGASYVVLSQDLASRLKLNTDKQQGIPLTIADGSTVNGTPVFLDSMRVGDVQADHVRAVILPNSPGEEIDGLLGMSFLQDFVISLDPANNKLVFKRFEPSA